jgi:hypothetical protein
MEHIKYYADFLSEQRRKLKATGLISESENSNLINVYPQSYPFTKSFEKKRTKYVDDLGNEFHGKHDEAESHYRKIHLSKSIKVHTNTRK